MEKTNSFIDLIMWKKSHDFVLESYKITENYPKEELFGLVSQLRKSAVSIPANIAEGYRRKGKAGKPEEASKSLNSYCKKLYEDVHKQLTTNNYSCNFLLLA